MNKQRYFYNSFYLVLGLLLLVLFTDLLLKIAVIKKGSFDRVGFRPGVFDQGCK